MIADNDGNLYVFSARNYVFKVNIETRVATYLGTIKGLPANFTTRLTVSMAGFVGFEVFSKLLFARSELRHPPVSG